ncbi:10854_t:CDS:2, partial [Funneliformis geosporum]
MQKTKVCYARVSSEHQRGITDYRPLTTLSGHKIISDIGSELNWKRKGTELVEWIFKKSQTQLVVLSSDICINDGETEELAEDLLVIVQ